MVGGDVVEFALKCWGYLERWLSSYRHLLVCKGSGFISQHWSAVPRDPIPSSSFCGYQAHMASMHICRKAPIHIKYNKFELKNHLDTIALSVGMGWSTVKQNHTTPPESRLGVEAFPWEATDV